MNILDIGAISMSGDLIRLNSIANNIANSATVGYKREISISKPFFSYLSANGDVVNQRSDTRFVQEMQSRVDYSAGTLKATGNPLDLALDTSNTFFEIAGPSGALYTRQGGFRVDSQGRLVTEAGYPVMGQSGEIFVNKQNPFIDSTGRILDGEKLLGQLRLVQVSNPEKLEQRGGGVFAIGQASIAQPERQVQVRQGYLENSNVNMVAEMVKMMEVTRHFELGQRVVQGYDGVLERAIRTFGEF